MDVNNQCLSVFKSFINDIIKVFPEYKIKLEDVYGSIIKLETCVIDECEILKEFLERVHKLDKKITMKDDAMFDDDPLILTDISFKNIWTTNITYKTKENIWKYLQAFCLIYMNYNSNKGLQSALEELSENNKADIKDKNIASDVKKIKKMVENIKEPIAQDIGDAQDCVEQSSEPDNPFEHIMNNSEIGKLAEQVSKELDIESMLGGSDSDNPMELFSNLMSGGAMNKIMGTIHNVVNTKVESGELNRESMVNEAQNMYGQLGQSEIFQQMTSQMGNQNSRTVNTKQAPNLAQENNPHASNKTKARLQKKLKEKQNIQVNKVDN
jgi:hypothetical protein